MKIRPISPIIMNMEKTPMQPAIKKHLKDMTSAELKEVKIEVLMMLAKLRLLTSGQNKRKSD